MHVSALNINRGHYDHKTRLTAQRDIDLQSNITSTNVIEPLENILTEHLQLIINAKDVIPSH